MNELTKTRKSVKAADETEMKARLAKSAHQMRMSGMTWWDIAEKLKVTEVVAKRAVSDRITDAAEAVDYYEKREFLAIELDRLDALQASVWDEAMDGKIPAIQATLAIMDRRAKWLGFAEPQVQTSVTSNTIIVPGNPKDYVAALQKVRSEIEAA